MKNTKREPCDVFNNHDPLLNHDPLKEPFPHSPSFDCMALERANPKTFCKYICVAQLYLCLESALENTLNTSAAKASVSAVPRASEVNDVVKHIVGIVILISQL